VLTAFFLEAGFLGVMLFGWTRVGPGLHFLATCMVAVGTLISATWILGSNSWMQTPQGYAIVDGRPHGAGRLAGSSSIPPFRIGWCTCRSPPFCRRADRRRLGAWQLLRGRDNRRCAPCCRWRCGCC
jgi:cytochrome d ubiquinol oxidase subunit I